MQLYIRKSIVFFYCFFVILYPTVGTTPHFFVTNPDDQSSSLKLMIVEQNEMANVIQSFFNTNLSSRGTGKAVNRATSDFFHEWARENVPYEYVRVNLDGLILDKNYKPTILLETKRSFYQLNRWRPFRADARNYYLQSSNDTLMSA